MKKIAVMTAGGDCPGLNAAIKSIVKTSEKLGIKVVGIKNGYIGFINGDFIEDIDVEGIELIGGTILGSSNKDYPKRYLNPKTGKVEDITKECVDRLLKMKIEALIMIGGDGTLTLCRDIESYGLKVIGIPKTIDNDMVGSTPTIGYDTAVNTNVEVMSKLRTTANSHRRIMVVEIMGRTAGFLTLDSGLAGGADVILLPEQDYDLQKLAVNVKKIMENKRSCIIAISESAKEIGKEAIVSRIVESDQYESKRYGGVSFMLAKKLEDLTGYEARNMTLGHMQRGGSPIPRDIIMGYCLGSYAVELLSQNETGYIVGLNKGELTKTLIPEKVKARLLDIKTNRNYKIAKQMGVYFGD